ncbi:MAG TPA: ABC transporter substrate-binding protein [Lacisediminihabitans sp.]|uniref:ABC transporter substrate-binding protein n=1 Tax=Lacisediminihabitans sp. TaxID=2787631 RepID=UPI002ED97FED
MRSTLPRRTRVAALAAITVTALAALSGCAPSSGSAESTGDTKDVTINQAVQTLLYLPLYVAQEKGYFEDEGVHVTIDTGGSGNASFAAVLGGSAGFSIQDPVFSAKSHEQGGQGVIVAGVQNAPAEFLLGKDGTSAQHDPTVLNGKKVVVSPSPDSTWALMTAMIEEYKLKDVQLVNVSLGNELAAVASGQADYAVVPEPSVSQGVDQQNLHVVYSWPAAGADWNPFAFSSLTSTQKYVKANPKATQGVVNAFQRAYNFIYSDEAGAVEVAEKYFPKLDKSTVASAVKREIQADGYPHTATVTEKAWDHNLQLAAKIGNVKAYPADATSYTTNVDTTFSDKAARAYPAKG